MKSIREYIKSSGCFSQKHKKSANKIFIFLSENQGLEASKQLKSQAAWLISSSHGVPLQLITEGALSELQAEEADEIVLIVPAHEVLVTQVLLPKLSSYRLRQVLPYALEEQILDELEVLHFAPGPYQMSPQAKEKNKNQFNLPLAFVKKTVLEGWLSLLRENGIEPDLIIPDLFALPYHEKQWQLFIDQDFVRVRTGLYTGFSADVQNLEILLDLNMNEVEKKPEQLIIYYEEGLNCVFPSLALPFEKRPLTKKQRLELESSAVESYPSINLLQAPYLPARKLRVPETHQKIWKLSVSIFLCWLGLLLLTKLGSLFILSYEQWQVKKQLNGIYQLYFPQEKALLDPRSKIEIKLKKILAEREQKLFFHLLGSIAKASSAIRIQRMDFQDKQLRLELSAPSFASLDEFIQSLKAGGLEVNQERAILAGVQLKAILLIQGKRS